MSRILIGSPVRQQSNILKEFLLGLEEADKGSNQIEYFFVDDNSETASTELLLNFAKSNEVTIKKGSELYRVEDNWDGHAWKAVHLEKVTVYKNAMIEYCIKKGFDYLFLIDSDIVIDKRTIPQLLSDNVDIVSNIFWFESGSMYHPNVFWIPDIYLQEKEFCEPRPFQESHKIRMDMFETLRKPGLYQVDGLGACTMISRKALEAGVSFKEIPNLKIFGEDRPFCIRAGALGFDLYMDTYYPAYHLYKEEYLSRVDEFKRDGFKYDMCRSIKTEEPKKVKKFPKIRKFIVRVGKKLVRDFSD